MESQVSKVVGVDTHKAGHSAALVDGLGASSEPGVALGGRGHRQLWSGSGQLPG